MATTKIELNIDSLVAEITLVAPEGKPPALDETVLLELERKVAEIEQSGARIAFLSSASERFFCVGANINALKEIGVETIGPWVKLGHRVFNRLEDLSCPVVALVKGYAMGGGLELALACDLIFASDTAIFALPEARLGFIPGWGGTRRLADRIGVSRAKYYFYSALRLDGQAARDCGLVDFLGTAAEVEEQKREYAEQVKLNSNYAVSTFKKMVNREMLERRERNAEQEAEDSVGCLRDEDTLDRLNAFLNKKG